MSVTPDEIARAASIITEGGLVAFPTETVYGLGADATNERAVRAAYALKGRPANNPLIVHCLGISHARMFSAPWPDEAFELVKRHWPGPLTIVVRRNAFIPDAVTGGGDTVALRVPDNAVARALIEVASVPLVGPSANPSGTVSPTTAQHVRDAFRDLAVLDDGPCVTGIESTVVTFAEETPRVLRPGVLGHEELGVAPFRVAPVSDRCSPMPSPGLFRSHYAPRARVVFDEGEADGPVGHLVLPSDAAEAARTLYARLRALDDDNVATIIATLPADAGPVWDAIRDRLHRAACPRG